MKAELLNILLVEDDEVDVMTVKRAFKKGHLANRLCVAGDGIEALEKLRGGEIPPQRRLVLLDLNMPRMNGIEFLKELRKDPQLCQTLVVVLATSDTDRDKFAAYDMNIAGYLVKPVTFEKFCELVVTLDKYWTLVEFP
jgi:CheY-like chemotaxis protein